LRAARTSKLSEACGAVPPAVTSRHVDAAAAQLLESSRRQLEDAHGGSSTRASVDIHMTHATWQDEGITPTQPMRASGVRTMVGSGTIDTLPMGRLPAGEARGWSTVGRT
jgi:hypothetical protein